MIYRPSRYNVRATLPSYDSRYWGPWPDGNRPTPAALAAAAATGISAGGILTTGSMGLTFAANRPAGLTTAFDRQFNPIDPVIPGGVLPPSGLTGTDSYEGHWFGGSPATPPVIDTVANLSTLLGLSLPALPDGFPTAMAIKYPSGFNAGETPFGFFYVGNALAFPLKKIYMCCWVLTPHTFRSNSNNIKWAQIQSNGSPANSNHIFMFCSGDNTGDGRTSWMITQGGGGTFYMGGGPQSAEKPSPTTTLPYPPPQGTGPGWLASAYNVWNLHEWEAECESVPGVSADGVFRGRINGVLVNEWDNLTFNAASGDSNGFNNFQFEPYYGGGGSAAPADEYIVVGRMLMAGTGPPYAGAAITTSSASGSLTTAAGGTPPAAPTRPQVVLQGQTTQLAQTFHSGANAGFVPASGDNQSQSPNVQTVAWKSSVAGSFALGSYNIWRRHVSTSGADSGYVLYDSITASAAASAYSAYASASAGKVFSTDVDCCYVDAAATNCAAYPRGTMGNGVDYYNSDGYTYMIEPVDTMGTKGSKSADTILTYFANGAAIFNAGIFNGTVTYGDTGGGTTPLGFTKAGKWVTVNSNDIINPYGGNGSTEWQLNVRGYNYLIINVRAAQAGSVLQLIPELEGDVQMGADSNFLSLLSSTYGTIANGSWSTIKIPLSDIMTALATSGSGATFLASGLQHAWYKVTIQDNGGIGRTYWLEIYFSVT